MIENAKHDDAGEIAMLWNHYVQTSTATFRSALYDESEIRALIDECHDADGAFFVARNEAFLGFALYRQFRKGDGYAMTMEHSIYLDQKAQGRGIGKALMEALEKHARRRKIHSFIGGVTYENRESIAFHERVGFRVTGIVPQVARKFDRWHDIAFMQKILKD